MTHREKYPEQYAHPLVGKWVSYKDSTWRKVERVVYSKEFGEMVHCRTGNTDWVYRIADLAVLDETRS